MSCPPLGSVRESLTWRSGIHMLQKLWARVRTPNLKNNPQYPRVPRPCTKRLRDRSLGWYQHLQLHTDPRGWTTGTPEPRAPRSRTLTKHQQMGCHKNDDGATKVCKLGSTMSDPLKFHLLGPAVWNLWRRTLSSGIKKAPLSWELSRS